MKPAYLFYVLALSLTGCSAWDNYKHTETETPDAWKTPAGTPFAWPDNEWWKEFNSPVLTSQIEDANKANFDLAAAVARVREADAQARIAGAALLPSVGATAGADRTRTPGGKVSSTDVSSSPRVSNAYNAGLNASYEIDFWGKNWSAAEAARALAEGSRYDKETVELTVTSSVANTYFDILSTQERLKVAYDNLANSKEVLDTIRNRFKQGTATALDVAQQENVVATQNAAVPPLEQHLRQDLDAQAILLGKLPENMATPEEKLADIVIPEVGAGLPSELLERRPDVQSAEAQLVSANANIINARAQFFPSISLTASGGYASSALSQLFRPDSLLWSLGGSLAQPIFEGGLLRGQLELAQARYDEALQNYRKAVVSAFSDVEDSLVAVQQTAAEEDAQKMAEQTAHDAYELSQRQLAGGIVDITSVLNTQRTLFTSQDALLQAKLAHLQAIIGLYKSLGGGWKNDKPIDSASGTVLPFTDTPDMCSVPTPHPTEEKNPD
jgi:multidrug efflux system outer membrane protein